MTAWNGLETLYLASENTNFCTNILKKLIKKWVRRGTPRKNVKNAIKCSKIYLNLLDKIKNHIYAWFWMIATHQKIFLKIWLLPPPSLLFWSSVHCSYFAFFDSSKHILRREWNRHVSAFNEKENFSTLYVLLLYLHKAWLVAASF